MRQDAASTFAAAMKLQVTRAGFLNSVQESRDQARLVQRVIEIGRPHRGRQLRPKIECAGCGLG